MSKVIQMIEKDQKSQKMQVVSDIQKAEQLISNIIENVVQGNIEAPPVVIMMKMFDKILKNSITGIEDIALIQINKNDPQKKEMVIPDIIILRYLNGKN